MRRLKGSPVIDRRYRRAARPPVRFPAKVSVISRKWFGYNQLANCARPVNPASSSLLRKSALQPAGSWNAVPIGVAREFKIPDGRFRRESSTRPASRRRLPMAASGGRTPDAGFRGADSRGQIPDVREGQEAGVKAEEELMGPRFQIAHSRFQRADSAFRRADSRFTKGDGE
jgi:hypothetical protein